MKYKFLLGAIALGIQALACDICGCAPGTTYLGVLPQFNQNIVGLRFNYAQLNHPQTNFNAGDAQSRVLKDVFMSTEAWVRFYPTKKIQAFVFLPYRVHQRIESKRITTLSGAGDLRFQANYTLIDYGDSINSDWKNLLLIGAGVSLPIGKYQQRDDTRLMMPAVFQLGTGSTDYILNFTHTLRWRTWGLNTIGQYWFRGKNELTYNWGNQTSVNSSLFYWGETKKLAYLPSLGVSFNSFQKDEQYDVVKPETGGTVWQGTAGLDVYLGQFLLSAHIQIPVYQKISSNQPINTLSGGFSCNMFF